MTQVIRSQLHITADPNYCEPDYQEPAPDNGHDTKYQEPAPDNSRPHGAPDYQEPAPDNANEIGYQEPAPDNKHRSHGAPDRQGLGRCHDAQTSILHWPTKQLLSGLSFLRVFLELVVRLTTQCVKTCHFGTSRAPPCHIMVLSFTLVFESLYHGFATFTHIS